MSAAVGLLLVLITSIVALVATIVVARRARSANGAWMPALGGLLFGVAAFGVGCFASGLLHYGGTTVVGDTDTVSKCAAWWEQIDHLRGQLDGDGGPSLACRRAALDGVPKALLISGAVGCGAALGVAAALEIRRRRFERTLRTVAAG